MSEDSIIEFDKLKITTFKSKDKRDSTNSMHPFCGASHLQKYDIQMNHDNNHFFYH